MLADGAYDKAVQDVKYIIHIASGTIHGAGSTEEEYEALLIQPALNGTISILDAAYKTTTVKRIVITSSEVAIIPWEEFIAKEIDTVFDDAYQTPYPASPYHHPFEAYAAGKVRALVATKEFVKEKKPLFDIIHIMPGFTVGDNELVTDPKLIADAPFALHFLKFLGKILPGCDS